MSEPNNVVKVSEEDLYAAALAEAEAGTTRPGLWAKAFADSEGDENKRKALYIKLRVQQERERIQQEQKAAEALPAELARRVEQNLYEAFLGPKNTQYYLDRFAKFDRDGAVGRRAWSWNWSAFFCTGLWALYRKLYWLFFACWVIGGVGSIAEKSGHWKIAILIYVVSMVAFGLYGNFLSFQRVKRLVADRKRIDDLDPRLARLHPGAGVNVWVLWISGISGGVVAIGILAGIFVPKLVPPMIQKSGEPAIDLSALDTLPGDSEKQLKQEHQQAIETLSRRHPDWAVIVGPENSQTEYRKWLDKQPPEYQAKILASWNPSEVANSIDKFKKETK